MENGIVLDSRRGSNNTTSTQMSSVCGKSQRGSLGKLRFKKNSKVSKGKLKSRVKKPSLILMALMWTSLRKKLVINQTKKNVSLGST